MATYGLVLSFRGYKIVMTENYEALGRYTAARGRAESLVLARDVALRKLSGVVGRATSPVGTSTLGRNFDVAAARALLEEAEELNNNILALVAEANSHAAAANRRPLELV